MRIALAARLNKLPAEIDSMEYEDMLALIEHFHRESEEVKSHGNGANPHRAGTTKVTTKFQRAPRK